MTQRSYVRFFISAPYGAPTKKRTLSWCVIDILSGQTFNQRSKFVTHALVDMENSTIRLQSFRPYVLESGRGSRIHGKDV